MQTVRRAGTFDAAHRVMDEKVKCFNLHGHLYQYTLELRFEEVEKIGFAIDFKDMKKFDDKIDDLFDHGFIANPKDEALLSACNTIGDNGSKLWEMSLNGGGEYCNPTAENISKEMLMMAHLMFRNHPGLSVESLTLFETPKCSTFTQLVNVSIKNWQNWLERRQPELSLDSVLETL